jgi:hypothetical protein
MKKSESNMILFIVSHIFLHEISSDFQVSAKQIFHKSIEIGKFTNMTIRQLINFFSTV